MFDWSVITQNSNVILLGLWVTIKYTVVTSVIGLMIGLLVALIQLARARALVAAGRLFVEFFRNIPLLVWLLWAYYALPIMMGINISKEMAGILALSLYGAAYFAEIFRAGIQSIDEGQSDAAVALGMSYRQKLSRIILPQALRRMVPPLAGQMIIQLKNTTLLSVITVPDLLYQAEYVSSFTYRPLEVYTAVAIIFLIVLVPLTYVARRLEAHEVKA